MASSNSGDCAFEDDSCGWINPEERDSLDELNWERMEASKSEFRLPDHTTGTKEGYYMALSRNSVQVRGLLYVSTSVSLVEIVIFSAFSAKNAKK